VQQQHDAEHSTPTGNASGSGSANVALIWGQGGPAPDRLRLSRVVRVSLVACESGNAMYHALIELLLFWLLMLLLLLHEYGDGRMDSGPGGVPTQISTLIVIVTVIVAAVAIADDMIGIIGDDGEVAVSHHGSVRNWVETRVD